MILEEIAHLTCPAEDAAAFLDDLEARYLDWHPNHIAFRWLGPADNPQDRFFFNERIGSLRLRLHMKAQRPERFRLVCVPENPFWRLVFPGMSFAIVPEAGGCLYEHRIALRLGPLAPLLNRRVVEPVRRHMADEAVNLERLLGRSGR